MILILGAGLAFAVWGDLAGSGFYQAWCIAWTFVLAAMILREVSA